MASSDSSPSFIDPQLVLSHKFPEKSFSYDERDVALYALGIGACGGDAVDEKELKYVYHRDGQHLIKVLPTFAALLPFKTGGIELSDVPGLQFDPRLLLHGQQYIEMYKPFSSSSCALLCSLSGDYNPLHSDPMIAQAVGFSRPILHGLCTLGFAVRAIIKSICNGDETAVKSIFGRFLLHVYPGETLVTEMWPEGMKVIYQTKVKERNRSVLSGYVALKHISSSL